MLIVYSVDKKQRMCDPSYVPCIVFVNTPLAMVIDMLSSNVYQGNMPTLSYHAYIGGANAVIAT